MTRMGWTESGLLLLAALIAMNMAAPPMDIDAAAKEEAEKEVEEEKASK